MSEESSKLAMAKTVLTTIGSIAATSMVVHTVIREYLPDEFRDFLLAGLRRLFYRFSNEFTIVIDQYDKLLSNELYEAAEIYLGPKARVSSRIVKIGKTHNEKGYNMKMEEEDEVVDLFNGVKLKWILIVKEEATASRPGVMHWSSIKSQVRCFHLVFLEKHKDVVINSYLPFLLNEANLKNHEKKTLKLFTVDPDGYDMSTAWINVTLDHPATFDTLAMDPEQKEMILNDLQRFVKRRDFYWKVGKAWKRGYLLYGPPGTGKSSLIAAMANYLNFDVYDLELSAVKTNSDLRKLLVWTANKSILVVEDIDCSIELKERAINQATSSNTKNTSGEEEEENKVTLSGFLNFVDGLWSSCGDERIIIFTTNHKEKLDPALLRPGRMDVHVHMSYCTPSGFEILASNYLGLKDHPLFEQIKEFIRTINVTPAEVAEQLLKHDEAESTLHGLIDFFHMKKKEDEAAKSEKKEDEAAKSEKREDEAAKSEKKEDEAAKSKKKDEEEAEVATT